MRCLRRRDRPREREGRGYYGCLNASRRACENKVLIARKRLEDKFVAALSEKVLHPELLDQATNEPPRR
jgi:hypothetical protein